MADVDGTGGNGGKRDPLEAAVARGDDALAGEDSVQHLADLERTMDAMHMGVVLLDAKLDTLIINKAYRDLSRIPDGAVAVGAPFSRLMELNRRNGIYGDIDEEEWQRYLAGRVAEIRDGSVSPREFVHADGRTMMFSVTALSGGKRLLTYYEITDVKRRDAEIESANARTAETFANLRAMVDQMPIGVLVLDADMRAQVINRAFHEFWKIEPSRAGIGSGFRELMEASRGIDPYGADDEAWQRLMAEREAEIRAGVAGSRQLPLNDGRTLIASLAPLAGGKRLISYVDVTDMKEREAEAEDARKNLATVLESLPAGVIIYDRDDRFVFANRKLQETLPALKPVWQPGRSFREALVLGHSVGYFRQSGDPEIDSLYERDRDGWFDAMLAHYRLPNSSYERRNPDGRWYQVYDMRTEDGTFIGVRVDISDIKSREKALHDSMRQIDLFRHVMDELPVAAFIKAQDLSIEFVNKAWCALTGIAKEDVIGRTDRQLFGADDAENYSHDDIEVVATGNGREVEESVTHRDGTVRQLMTRKSRLVATDGSVHLVGSSTDITDVKARERALEE
ncbi:PAS-domain containing protein, partial [Mesorhizobium sp. M4A.F.Ca.ET.090.04.2.1]